MFLGLMRFEADIRSYFNSLRHNLQLLFDIPVLSGGVEDKGDN